MFFGASGSWRKFIATSWTRKIESSQKCTTNPSRGPGETRRTLTFLTPWNGSERVLPAVVQGQRVQEADGNPPAEASGVSGQVQKTQRWGREVGESRRARRHEDGAGTAGRRPERDWAPRVFKDRPHLETWKNCPPHQAWTDGLKCFLCQQNVVVM